MLARIECARRDAEARLDAPPQFKQCQRRSRRRGTGLGGRLTIHLGDGSLERCVAAWRKFANPPLAVLQPQRGTGYSISKGAQ